MSPLVSHLVSLGMVRAVAVPQDSVFSAAKLFLRCEGILPAPESAHAVSCVIESALRAKESGTPSVILFCLSGHGLMDMAAFS
jgi:tryptophan synthase beta chain